jgi:DNA-binding NarL/FixJ family response regulator
VLENLHCGLSNQGVSQILGTSEYTFKAGIKVIFTKLNFFNCSEAVTRGLELRIRDL